jgi:hypothetical protein
MRRVMKKSPNNPCATRQRTVLGRLTPLTALPLRRSLFMTLPKTYGPT